MKRKNLARNSSINEKEDGKCKSIKGEVTDSSFDFRIDELPIEKPKFICAICKKQFSDKNCLKKHIKKIHNVEPGPLLQTETTEKTKIAPFKCRVCETEFAYKRNLKRHLIKYHSQGLEDEEGGNCFCNVDGCKFRSFFINALRSHLAEEHKIPIDVENKIFSSKAEFDQWKEEEEKTNVCLFIKEAGKHTLINGDQRLIYQCHRSGHYSGHGYGKRSFRVKGTCKLGKRCTAGIELTVKEKADIHEVVYYKTHIWHTPDVLHVNLSASERTFLANKLKEGVSIASILESVKTDQSVEGTNLGKRIHLLKRKDLVNIENTFRLNNTERHLRKQHKKGQKMDLEKMKKNIDDYGEVVCWILESHNNSEYFTVKKLQPDKCTENCGVVCIPCNACLHMYSCTCHDYLLFGTMCPHIHCVCLSLNPILKPKRSSSKPNSITGTSKRKKKEKPDQHIEDVIEADHKGNDILNFFSKNLELQQEHELQQERIKLRDKLSYFNNLCLSKIDHLDESSIQMLVKIVDSAIGSLNSPCGTSELEMLTNVEQLQPTSALIVTNSIQLDNMQPLAIQSTNIQQDVQSDSHLAKQITNTNPIVLNNADRKYDVAPQFCSTLKKKRRTEETSFYRSSETVPNEHAVIHDNYATFDCTLSSWQQAPISTSNTSVGKWWT